MLVGKPIPQHIIDLPREILNTYFIGVLSLRSFFERFLQYLYFSFSSLGPMLRPLLEQAADPVHQIRSGHTPLFSKLASNSASNSAAGASKSNTNATTNEKIPSTALIYKPMVISIQKSNSLNSLREN